MVFKGRLRLVSCERIVGEVLWRLTARTTLLRTRGSRGSLFFVCEREPAQCGHHRIHWDYQRAEVFRSGTIHGHPSRQRARDHRVRSRWF